MKAVLRSIKPYWFYLICEGRKTIEVGKNKPTSEDWDKITYLYCSKDIKSFNRIPKEHREKYRKYLGKVGATFVCDEIICCQAYYGEGGLKHLTNIFDNELQQTCLTAYELFDYIVGKEKLGTGWLWCISELKIYDEQRELSEFRNLKGEPIKRAYQSWGYINE